MPCHAMEVDRPVAGLLQDLKLRGLLEETLVGWMAGGDVKGGATAGETDEFGIKALGEPIPLRDVHATILNLMGLSDERLTYLHAGRYRKLTDIGGRVLTEVIA